MDWKRIGKRLLFPKIWLMVLLVTGSAAALVYVFVKGLERSIPACAVYGISFYSLVTVTLSLCMIRKATKEIRRIKNGA